MERTPRGLSLPPKFRSWRPGQRESIDLMVDSPKRFSVISQPTGSGKSVSYVAAHQARCGKTVVLTSTKALQDQLMDDFAPVGMVSIKGQAAYTCDLQPEITVDKAPCKHGFDCELKEAGRCHYFSELERAQTSNLVVTNYHWWMSMNDTKFPFAKDVAFLVMDEGHAAYDSLLSFLAVGISEKDFVEVVGRTIPNHDQNLSRWAAWAINTLPDVTGLYEDTKARIGRSFAPGLLEKATVLQRVLKALDQVQSIGGDWKVRVEEVKGRPSYFWDPISPPFEAVDRILFGQVDRVVLTSATVSSKSIEMLGVEEGDYDIFESASTFPIDRRKVYPVKSCRMNYRTREEEMLERWLPVIDEIINRRGDRKGIIHTVSFKRRDFIMEHSEHRGIMYTNKNGNIQDIVDDFRSTYAPAVLVTPSVSTGYDFPYEDCQYQIICKVPFPNISSPILRSRSERDKDLVSYMTAQQLVQMAGRGTRAPDDFCETFIVDDVFLRWYADSEWLVPEWFRASIQKPRTTVPYPGMILGKNQPVGGE